jgi:hypothetical protein
VLNSLEIIYVNIIPTFFVCAKAARMTESEKRSAVARKRSKAQGVGGKPTNVKTFASQGGLADYYKGIV